MLPRQAVTSRFSSVTRRLPGFARGAAWFFIVFSVAHLVWVVGAKWENPANLTTLYQTTVGTETRRAFGLAYDGTLGLLLAIGQGIVVVGAAVASTRPQDRVRRIGHVVLTAWAGLWFADLTGLALFDGALDSVLQAGAAGTLFGCTLFRALDGVRRSGSTEPDLRCTDDTPGAAPTALEDAEPPEQDAGGSMARARTLAVLRGVHGATVKIGRAAHTAGRRAQPAIRRGWSWARTTVAARSRRGAIQSDSRLA